MKLGPKKYEAEIDEVEIQFPQTHLFSHWAISICVEMVSSIFDLFDCPTDIAL